MARSSLRRLLRGRRLLLLQAAALAARPALARAAAQAPARADAEPPSFRPRSAYVNISAALERAGGCGSGSPSGASAEDLAAASFACALGCQPHEGVLEKAFEPWWDHRLRPEALHEVCSEARATDSQAFIGAVSGGRVFFKCCLREGECDMGHTTLKEDIYPLLSLVAEVVEGTKLPDMQFLFSSDDQPFADKVHWNPVPTFHWVQSLGHWSIPWPNPYYLKAHFKDLLGDSSAHAARQVPWGEKVPKVFWRGTLSMPDNHALADVEVAPRARLLLIARRHPELFDVALAGVDEELVTKHSEEGLRDLRGRLGLPPPGRGVDMAATLPRFRYAINVCGVLSAWRVVELLASGSLLLLQEDATSELAYQWLTPWEHFVPVDASLSDLVPKVQWLEAHPERAEAIARQGFLRFQQRVRRQDTYCYLWQALRTLANATEPAELPGPESLRSMGWHEVDARGVAEALPSHRPIWESLRAGGGTEL